MVNVLEIALAIVMGAPRAGGGTLARTNKLLMQTIDDEGERVGAASCAFVSSFVDERV